jgi:hypothetical protein
MRLGDRKSAAIPNASSNPTRLIERPGQTERLCFMTTTSNQDAASSATATAAFPDLDERLRSLIVQRATQLAMFIDRTQIMIFHEASEQNIAESVGFSPLINPKNGCRYPSEGFRRFWSVRKYDGWFEMTFRLGDPVIVFLLLLKDCDSLEPSLRAVCEKFALSEL